MIPYLLLTRYYRVPDNVGIFLKYIIPRFAKMSECTFCLKERPAFLLNLRNLDNVEYILKHDKKILKR